MLKLRSLSILRDGDLLTFTKAAAAAAAAAATAVESFGLFVLLAVPQSSIAQPCTLQRSKYLEASSIVVFVRGVV
jgi:hypothetical protein